MRLGAYPHPHNPNRRQDGKDTLLRVVSFDPVRWVALSLGVFAYMARYGKNRHIVDLARKGCS
jgi:hypothetical protein